MKDNIIITEMNNTKYFICMTNGQIECLDTYENSDIGSIYVGIVENIIIGINASFVRFKTDTEGYLDSKDFNTNCILNNTNTNKLRQGDLVLVQVQNDPIKTKQAKLTCNISLSGKYVALTLGKRGIGASRKIASIRKDDIKIHLKGYIRNNDNFNFNNYGIVIRTEAGKADVTNEMIIEDLIETYEKLEYIITLAKTRSKFTVLYQKSETDFYNDKILKMIHFMEQHSISDFEIITDQNDIYYLYKNDFENIKLWNDHTSLAVLYGLDSKIKEIFGRKVWLKSGGFLIIEHTEAMEVIDVNSGKDINKKNLVFQTNMEAIEESFRQIRLRNLSGMIMIDIINTPDKDEKTALINKIKELCIKDPVQTNFIDITGLDIVEITRKKS